MQVLISYLTKRRVLLGIILVYSLLLFLKSFGLNVWTPSCPISAYTKYECLGCGMNHAAMAVMHLDFSEAWRHNPLIFLYLPLIFGWIGYDFYKYSAKLKAETKNQ